MNKPLILFNLVRNLKKYHNQPDVRPYECFRAVLDLPRDSDIKKHLVYLSQMAYDVASHLEADNPLLNDRTWVTKLVNVLTHPFEQVGQFNAKLNDLYPIVEISLASHVRAWDHISSINKALTDDEITNLKENTRQLLDEVIKLDSVDAKVKVYLIDQLKKVLNVLDNYQIYGHEKLIDILEKSIGHVIVDKNYEKFMCDSSQSENWKKYLTDLSTVITLSSGVMPLLQSLQGYLP
ncbi:hypothetical protein NCU84_15620 [Acinetobacter baumannii]|uniref:Uncharacterized protein n=5 Tax=Acinetobacter baumannii TaxID=470 RepID=D0C8J2_ACIB2|nr:hypothetical protein [Acinetobacter baumannii]EEX05307.1 hypothetical protein HMPREF0010_01072 [Acinetobacter baumannii ATCC 19606 = CIP 70.34 = JCM 6841]ENW74695.1 hypothetical protein F911_02443 [Acinetobacter baumannii ATCC 19606 = CIP 70.34 = JCM 6841]KFC03658.1 hypothetical protein DJ41_2039 [Acinetobacter baumannii ATCC 19606 = CIP 70.34 = JCM 6841]MBN3720539.1 hypothetical protein [Acinetobacter baumannii]MCW1260544.1 hypothetical protein [Acinetobacter baumannii]